MIHPIADAGFGSEADRYERSRPGYPPAAIARIAALADGRVVDVGAGTGKLTRSLVSAGLDVVAVEPVDGMRRHLATVAPLVVGGVAEHLPFGADSFSLGTVGQAFHWFDGPAASQELARVIQPDGALVSIWNARQADDGWQREIWAIMDRVERDAPWRIHSEKESNQPRSPWREVERHSFDNPVPTSRELVIDRMASASHIGSLPEDEKQAVLAEVAAVVAGVPEPLTLRYRTDMFVFRR